MDLKELFESNLLNEETKTVLTEAFESAVEAKRVEIEEQFSGKLEEVRAEMTNQNIQLIESALEDEIQSLAEEVAEARTLDVRYATQLNEFKEKYDEKMTEMVTTMVAEQVAEEISELKEDIEFAKKHQFATSIFEAFREAYEGTFVSEGEEENVRAQLAEATQELESLKRQSTMEDLLEGLSGTKRQVAVTLLENTATDKLESRFESLKSILLAESGEVKDKETLNEGAEGTKDKPAGIAVIEESDEVKDASAAQKDTPANSALMRAIRNAGIQIK